jgi:tyrosyl-tRNA synthetase
LPTVSCGEALTIVQALTALGFAGSNKEARRKVDEGAVRVDDQPVSDPALLLTVGQQPLKISLGRKKHGLIVR